MINEWNKNEQLVDALNAHAIVSITDPQGRITDVNDKFVEVSGYPREELIGQPHSIIRSQEHDDDFYRALWTRIKSGKIWNGTFCNRRKDGNPYWVESTIAPIFVDGAITEYVSVRTDITNKILHQKTIEAQYSTLEKIMLSVQFVLFRERIEDESWYQQETDRLGSYAFDALDLRAARVRDNHRHLLEEARKYPGLEVKLQFDFGEDSPEYEWFALKLISDVTSDRGKPERLFYVRRIEEYEVAVRTAQTAVEEMRIADRKKNQLYGTIAHELRTPAAAIQMLCELEDTDYLAQRSEMKKAILKLISAIDDMKGVIDPDIARPVREDLIRLTDFQQLISDLVTPAISAANIQFEYIDSIPWHLARHQTKTDVYRIKMIVAQLVQNAAMHSGGSKITVTSSVSFDEHNGSTLHWIIRDDGSGMEPGYVASRMLGEDNADITSPGKGLGLSKANLWASDLNGTLEFKARQRGSKFILSVPACLDRSSQSGRDSNESDTCIEATGQNLNELRPLNILLVEDDPMIRLLSQRLLTALGMSVDVAEDGQIGLAKYSDEYDLILSDYFMPNMNGVQMIKALREQAVRVPIVGVTAATLGDQQNEMITAGASLVVPKPLTAEVFRSIVARLLLDEIGASCESASQGPAC